MNRSNFLWEYRSYVKRAGPPTYVPFFELTRLTGFQSVFGIPIQDALNNIRRGSVEGGVYPVYCDTLLVDFDDKPEKAENFQKFLNSLHVAHFKCDSGNRSIHFHVPIFPIIGENVPYSVKRFVEKYGEGADLSFYLYNGQYRLLGTKHRKTGRVKKILEKVKGRRLEIPLLDMPEDRLTGGSFLGESTPLQLLQKAVSLMHDYPGKGNRHIKLWSYAQQLYENLPITGDKIEVITALVSCINTQWGLEGNETKTEDEIRGIILQIK
jgi:hypothetical protein